MTRTAPRPGFLAIVVAVVLALLVAMPAPAPADVQDPIDTRRVAGADRYETAADLAVRGVGSGPVDRVWLATGENFPDALAASATGEPVVLVLPDRLPSASARALERLAPQEVVAVGGRLAISGDVLAAAGRAAGAGTAREHGQDRFATSAEVSRRSHPDGADTVWLATGLGFADALAAGPVAAAEQAPVLLSATDEVPRPVRAELERLAPERIVVVGGTAAVTARAADQARAAAGGATVTRLQGADRYATAAAIARRGVSRHGLDGPVHLATGESFPDALAAGPAAFRAGGTLLLTPGAMVPDVVRKALLEIRPPRLVLAGGTAALSRTVEHRASRPWLEGACDLYDITRQDSIQGHPENQRPSLDAWSGPWIVDDFRDTWGLAVPWRWRYDRVESLEHRGVLFYVDTENGYENYLSVTVLCGNPYLMGNGQILDADDPQQIAAQGPPHGREDPDYESFSGPALYTVAFYDEPCPPHLASRSRVCAERYDYVAVDDDVILIHYMAEDQYARDLPGSLGRIADRVAASVAPIAEVDCPANASECRRR